MDLFWCSTHEYLVKTDYTKQVYHLFFIASPNCEILYDMKTEWFIPLSYAVHNCIGLQ